MVKYPIYLDLEGRHVVLVGGGAVALRKAEVLLGAGARLVIIAEQTNEALTVLGKQGRVELVRGKYAKQYITEAVLVIAATNNRQVNEQIYRDCQSLEVLCNVVDDIRTCAISSCRP
jgi:uroporphyrin-III C-methyltransferase/precorrin-2 dehydrogenase/sirohydrochlorin ferrochelatase